MTNRTTEKQCRRGKHAARHWGIIAAIAACLALAVGCSDDPPVTPEPVHYNIYVSATDYLYLNGGKHNGFYVYDADSLTLIDSIPLPHIGGWAEASPDGRSLYTLLWRYKDPPHDYYLARIDVASRSIVWTAEIPPLMGASDGPINLLDDGRVLALEGVLFDPETGAIVRQQDYRNENHWIMEYGPLHGTELAAIQFDSLPSDYYDRSDTLVVAVDLTTGQQRGHFVPRFTPGQYPLFVYYARLHPDGERVLLMSENSAGAWFMVGNLNTGELLLAARLSTSIGEIAISADGTLAVVVDQANAFFGYGIPAVYVYDLVNYQHLKTFDPYNDLVYWPGQVRFLPGDRRIAVFPPNSGIVGWLQTFDLNTMTREPMVDAPFSPPNAGGIAVGPRPAP